MRKGRCSNIPSACSFAASGKLLPFAGEGSLCPECGSPLAYVAATEDGSAPMQYTQNTSARAQHNDEYEEGPNQALEFAKIAAVIAVLGAGVFFGMRFLNQNQTNSVENAPAVTTDAVSAPIVQEINPPMVAKLAAISDVKSSPDATAASVGQFGAGSIFDVNGRVSVNGIDWVRVTVPNNATAFGYIEISKLIGVSGAPFILGNMVTPIDVQAPVPVVSEITDLPESIFYVSSSQANLRAEAGATSAKVGMSVLGDTLTVTGSRTIDGKLWYRINLPAGGVGWVSGPLLSKTKPAPPPPEIDKTNIPDAPSAEIAEGSYVVISSDKAKIMTEIGSEIAIDAAVQKGMAVQIQSIEEINGQKWYKVRSKRFNIDGWIQPSLVKPVN